MKWGRYKKSTLTLLASLAFVTIGTYNAVVINSESHINSNDVKFVKRLDEMYGIIKPGREVAATVKWEKLKAAPYRDEIIQQVSSSQSAGSAPVENPVETVTAAIKEELNMSLAEVVNPKKWPQGLKVDQSSVKGDLKTNNGIIESLSVSLPETSGIEISFSEMTGNVFEYLMDNEVYSGMLYQSDQHTYMINLSNGPLEGTRLKFTSQATEPEPELGNSESQIIAEENLGQPTDEQLAIQEQPVVESQEQVAQEVPIQAAQEEAPAVAPDYTSQALQENLNQQDQAFQQLEAPING